MLKAEGSKWAISLMIFGLLAGGCDETDPTVANPGDSSTSCGTGQAQILVSEAFVEDLCGCAEGKAIVQTSGQSLPCTVAPNTQVAFQYLSTVNNHQIISIGSPSFPSSPPFGPASQEYGPDGGAPLVWAIPFSQPGTYSYQDAYSPNVIGEIIVQ